MQQGYITGRRLPADDRQLVGVDREALRSASPKRPASLAGQKVGKVLDVEPHPQMDRTDERQFGGSQGEYTYWQRMSAIAGTPADDRAVSTCLS
jgi:hypothetical protein